MNDKCCDKKKLKYIDMVNIDGFLCEHSICLSCKGNHYRYPDDSVVRHDRPERVKVGELTKGIPYEL